MTMSYKGSATKFRENSERLREKLKVPQSTWDAGLVSLAKFIKPILPNLSELIYPERSLDQARGKEIYKELIADDVLHFCQTRLKDYQPDIIFAADVCCYIGQLEELIRACRPYQLAFFN